jgi:chemotaxis signal transduction protein
VNAAFAGGDGFICCTVGSQQFAFRASDVHHVSRADKLRAGSDEDGRIGTLKMSGQLIPVFGLGRALGEPDACGSAARSAGQHIAVTGRPGELVGWLVDHIARAVDSDGATVVPLPRLVGAQATTWFDALVRLGETLVLLLAPHRIGPFGTPVTESHRATSAEAGGTPSLPTAPMTLLFSTPALPRCAAPRYAISARQIVAIVKALQLIRVPGSAPHVTGVSWWRNTAVPVIDFRDSLDRAAPLSHSRCLLAQCGGPLRGTIVAVPIDPDIDTHKPADSDRGLTDTSLPPFVDGAFQVGGETAALLNLDTLLTIHQES